MLYIPAVFFPQFFSPNKQFSVLKIICLCLALAEFMSFFFYLFVESPCCVKLIFFLVRTFYIVKYLQYEVNS